MHEIYKQVKPAVIIKNLLDVIHEPGEVFEVRIPKTKAGTLSGYFNDTTKAAAILAKENGKHQGIYATVNPVKPELLARMDNKIGITQVTTTDAEIERRRWFLLDFDPVRAAGISSTDAELEASKECAEAVVEWLTSIGWPEPLQACSGNGWHLMYRVDEPNDDDTRGLFDYATKMLASIFSNDKVNVDIAVFNASRIWKVYGTISAKGSHTEDRPHRVANITKVPKEFTLVTREQIENVARPLKDAKSDEYKNMAGEYIADMTKWLSDRGLTVTSGPRPMFGNEGQKWTISRCPFNPAHNNPMVGLVNNRPVFRCLHNSCSAFRWKEFREKVDPTYKDPDTIYARLKEWCDSDLETIEGELIQAACSTGRKLDGILKRLRKETPRARVIALEEHVKEERRRFQRATIGENNEKGNIVGLINRTKIYQEEGIVPMYWIAEYDYRVRSGEVGDINCPKATEFDEINLMVKFHTAGDTWVKQTHAAQVIKILAEERKVNPLKVWLKTKRWDGIKRLDTWLPDYMGTKNDEYTRAIGRKWMISAVARAMEPGCQVDHMLIFEGKQGVGKSQAARILGGQFYVEYSGNVKGQGAHKDLVAVIVGKMVVEMSELAAMRRADMESLKAMLTTCVDDVRLSYERDARAYPRTCVFIGTTNEVGSPYIMDVTGARRFWPCVVGEKHPVNTKLLAENVDQMWAEAVEAYESGEDWHTVPADAVAREQADRQVSVEEFDPWYSKIRSALTDPDNYGTIFHAVDLFTDGEPDGRFVVRLARFDAILGSILGIETARQTANDSIRLQKVLKAIGFERSRPSKSWMNKHANGNIARDLTREHVPHLWSAIDAARRAVKFPNPEPEYDDEEPDR